MTEPQLFSIIYADPAWLYKDTMDAGKRGAGHKYQLMTLNDIKALPVERVAAQDSELWIWGTWPLYREVYEVIEAWGFAYKTLGFDWMKISQAGKPLIRGGSGTRSNTEFCLRAIRGDGLKRISMGVPSAILSVPDKKHSRKPAVARERIVKLFGDLPRLELFATDLCEGWVSLGNEIDGQDIRETLPRLIPPAPSGSQISIWDFGG
jgi:N6-adenosine-specific RNA methylase IME4